MNDLSILQREKSNLKGFSDTWEVEDSFFPGIVNTLEANPSKNFSRERNEVKKSSSPIKFDGLSLGSFEVESQSVINGYNWKKKRRNQNNENKSKVMSLHSDAQGSKETMRQSINETQKMNSAKKKTKFLGKLFLVKKFVKNLRESTIFRSYKWLKGLHYDIINDWSYFFSKSNQINTRLEVLINLPKIKPVLNFFALFNPIKSLYRFYDKFHGFIIYPSNFLRLFWDSFMVILTIHNFIMIPLNVGFTKDYFQEETSFLNFNTIYLFLIDVFLNLNTAYYCKGELIKSRMSIVLNYLMKGSLLRDILSLSFLIFTQFFDLSESPLIKLSSLFFLLRVKNLSKAISRFEEFFFSDEQTDNMISFLRLIFIIFLFSHWCACFYILIGKCESNEGWMIFYNVNNSNVVTQYLSSLYFIVVVMNTVGFGDMVPITTKERVFTICFIMIASIVFAYTINQIGTILYNISKNERELKRTMNLINGYMKAKNINFGLKIKIRNYLEYLWDSNKNRNFQETQEIINKLSKNLKDELLLNANGLILKNIPFLTENFSEETLQKIVYEMKEINLTPGDIIYNQNGVTDMGDPNFNFYIIRDGEIGLFLETPRNYSENQKFLRILRKGEYFGEFSCFTGFPRQTSAKSLSFSSLFVISGNSYIRILKENPEDYEKYCLIRDQINLSHDFSKLHRKCFSCQQTNHTELDCPKLHLILSKDRLLQKYNYSPPQIRMKFERKRQKKFNALRNNRTVDEQLSCFLKKKLRSEFSTFENEESLVDIESDSSEKDPSFVLKEIQHQKTQPKSDDHLDSEFKKNGDVIPSEKIKVSNNNLMISDTKADQKIEFDQVKSYFHYFSNGNIENIIDKIFEYVAIKKKSKKNIFSESSWQFKPRKSIFNVSSSQFQSTNKTPKAAHLIIKNLKKKDSLKSNNFQKEFNSDSKASKEKRNAFLQLMIDCLNFLKKMFSKKYF